MIRKTEIKADMYPAMEKLERITKDRRRSRKKEIADATLSSILCPAIIPRKNEIIPTISTRNAERSPLNRDTRATREGIAEGIRAGCITTSLISNGPPPGDQRN
jgi:uncharacterized DUF497 family protein